MTEAGQDQKQTWLERVLGVKFPAAETQAAAGSDGRQDFARLWAEAASRWRDASEAVDSQIGQLQQALKQTDDDELHDIAEFGLNGITGGTKVKLMAAIRDVSSAGDKVPASIAGKARTAVARFRDQITGDARVDACDENPFGVAVRIRATFGPALAGLETALKSA